MRGNRRNVVVATLFTALVGMPAWAGLIHGGEADNSGRANNAATGCMALDRLGAENNACEPGRGNFIGSGRSPIALPQDDGISLKSLGITSADQVGVLFNGATPTSDELTLKVYSGATLVLTISGDFSGKTELVNGKSEFLFNLDATSIGELNAAIAGNLGDTIELESTNAKGDADGYSLVDVNNLGAAPATTGDDPAVPEPATIWLAASSVLGLAVWRRRKLFGSSR